MSTLPSSMNPAQRPAPAAAKAALARAAEAEAELARFFTQSPDLLCIAGLDGYFKRLNPAWAIRLGWSLDELQASPFLDFVHPDDRERTRAEVAKLAAGAETIFFENRYRHRNGSYHWLQWNARPVPGRRRIHATARDVTRRRRQEREILEVADREKERLGRELHDGLCQSLAGIAALSSMLWRRLAAASEASAAATAAEITSLLNDAIGQARDLARGLAPSGLDTGGLGTALEVQAASVERLFRVSCGFVGPQEFPRLACDDEDHLFRIAQEAVSNAVAHARAARVEIGLAVADGRAVLTVRDDGVGLPECPPDGRGMGLHTMAYRARLIGASLEVRRRAARGTIVICSLPLRLVPSQPGRGSEPAAGSGAPQRGACERTGS